MAGQPLSRRQVLGGLAGSLVAAATPLFAQDSVAHRDLGMFPPEPPTAERPYHYYRFDASTKDSHPDFSPNDVVSFERDKFVLLNFVDASEAGRDRSILQMRLLDKLARDLGPTIGPKEFLVADVIARGQDGEAIYTAAYQAFYEDNRLGHGNTLEDDQILPYGVAFSQSAKAPELGMQRLMDFSVNRFNVSEPQMRENIKIIAANMHAHARAQNPDRIASLDLAERN